MDGRGGAARPGKMLHRSSDSTLGHAQTIWDSAASSRSNPNGDVMETLFRFRKHKRLLQWNSRTHFKQLGRGSNFDILKAACSETSKHDAIGKLRRGEGEESRIRMWRGMNIGVVQDEGFRLQAQLKEKNGEMSAGGTNNVHRRNFWGKEEPDVGEVAGDGEPAENLKVGEYVIAWNAQVERLEDILWQLDPLEYSKIRGITCKALDAACVKQRSFPICR
ncbi:hypothetical protein C8J57DRAFT_1466269 [Mycena rebaudengoi]|nr:hypothetical protein C8J57DRAFT_1466269 [Mycena rebaudengoi]